MGAGARTTVVAELMLSDRSSVFCRIYSDLEEVPKGVFRARFSSKKTASKSWVRIAYL